MSHAPSLASVFAEAAKYFPSPLQQFQFFDKTSRFDYEKGRRETWPETVDRAVEYLCELAPPMTGWLCSEGREMILTMQALPSMRLLAMAGPAARRQNLSIYNCFAGDEQFLTPAGPRKFVDAVGQHVIVRASDGKWKAATVQHFGKQALVEVTLRHWNGSKAGNYLHKIKATPNHRWLLLSGTETTTLRVGDKLRPSVAPAFTQNIEAERHGFVYGDGTLTHTGKYTYAMVRLCGAKQKYLTTIFAGCNHSFPPSFKGEPMVYLGRAGTGYKGLPVDPTPDYARGFIEGLGKADGALSAGGNLRIDTQKADLLAWLKKYAPLAGYAMLSVRTYNTPTNYGPRKAPLHQILLGKAETSVFRVEAIEPLHTAEDVYCVIEPETHTFTLASGILTGNCSFLAVDDVEAFPEMLIISMSGCGVGFSVEQRNIDKLPVVELQTGEHIGTHIVGDSAEGWAEALRLGLNTWWNGADVDFDVSQVRPAGAVLFTKGGRASGPEPLLRMLSTIRGIILSRQGLSLRSIDAHDIACAVGDAAVSGGMRRTAMISLYSQGDALMRAAKTGDYPSIRWNANNSEVWRRDPTDAEIEAQMAAMFAGQNGEPGIFSGAAAARTMPARRRELWERELGVSVEETSGTNPCQPAFATVLTPEGIRIFADIDVGSIIWSGKQWTRVARKVYTGVKPVQMFVTNNGHFIGTEDHRVVSKGVKIPVRDAASIDTAPYPADLRLPIGLPYDISYSKHSEIKNPVLQVIPLGNHPVYDITVEADEHMYWTGGLLVSNCGEIVLRATPDGGGLCNLSIAVARSDDTFDTLCHKVVAATVFGTIQATATHFPGLRPGWKRNAESERLLGVDITGQMDCPLLTGPSAAEIFDQLRQISLDVNVDTAAQLGINPAASITTVKPAGNSAALLNCSSGVHGRHARFYVRNARVSAHSPVYHVLRDAGAPLSPENGQTAENATTWVCAFPVASPSGAVVKGDLSADDQLAHWLLNKRHWTEHNPSCFTGDTRFITKAGLRRFDACFENETVEILNKKGRFVPATVKAFGVQDVWELVLTRCGIRRVIHTTKNHLWPVTTEMQRFRGEPVKYKQTHELRAGVALLTVNPTQIPALDPLAVLHGIVYGDGTKNKTRCSIALCFDPKGADSRLLAPLFEKAGFRAVVRDDLKQVRFYGLPAHWKTLPPDTASPEYLRGFVAGWFAADGTCLRTVQIAAKERAALEWLQRLAPKAGLAVSTKIGQRQSKEHDSFKAGVYHTLTLCKETLDPAFFVLPGKKTGPAKFKKYWKVVSAQPTHTQAPVFCVVEPQGQAFCLEGNILTHNCTITYRPEEEAELIAWVKAHREEIGGISFLPAFDAAYEQMPYVEVDEAEYERRLAAFPAIDWSRIALYEQTDTTTSAQELVCTGDRCELK